MTKRLILVAGNIGAGKTSLTERIGERMDWQTAFESVSDNPYLPDFYADMRTWSFHLQIFFLGHRASSTWKWPHPNRPSWTAAFTKTPISSPAPCMTWVT